MVNVSMENLEKMNRDNPDSPYRGLFIEKLFLIILHYNIPSGSDLKEEFI